MLKINKVGYWPLYVLGILINLSQAHAQDTTEKKLPLEGSREIKINTTEGTWLSLDVSPDGQTIIFDMLGDLYLLPIKGGKAQQLTSGLAMDTKARFSPDGKSLVFISDRDGAENLWLMNMETQKFTQLTKDKDVHYESADWSPDGNYIVTSRGKGVLKLHLYHRDGGNGVALTKDPAIMKDVEPAFGGEEQLIWFSRRKGMWEYNAQFPQYQLYTYDRETGKTEVKTSRYGSAFAPTLSTDGNWLVYGTRYNTQTGLRARNLKTGKEKWLAYPVQRDEQESLATMGVLPGMAFTADNQFLVASYGGKIYKLPIHGGAAEEIPFEVETTLSIGPALDFAYPVSDEKMMTVTQIRDPKISPDGKKLVFSALDKLYMMDYPKGTPKRLTNTDQTEAQPAWSPDSKNLVYATWNKVDGGALYKIRATSGQQPKRLTETTGIYRDPVWSPDGTRIVFRRSPTSDYSAGTANFDAGVGERLEWVAAEGGENQLISSQDVGLHPHFVQDDNRIYQYAAADGLYSIRWDGTDKKCVVKVKGRNTYNFQISARELPDIPSAFDFDEKDSPASLIIKAPVGDKALALINNEIYVVTVPYSGGDTPTISVADVKNASFPSWKLTEIGGEFPFWSADGQTVYWSLGHGFFTCDLSALQQQKTEDKENAYQPVELKIKVDVPRDIPQGTILLQGARIITMKGEEVFQKGDLLIENNRIREIGESGSFSVPAGTKTLNVEGKTIVPGFIDTHAHMWPRWEIHTDQVWRYAANLAYGVTTTRDPQTSSTDVLTYADRVDAGEMLGPRIYSTGPGIAMWSYNLQSLDHTRRVLRQYSEYYNTKTIKMYLVGNRQQRQWVVMAAREQQLMPTTEGGLDFRLNITEILDGYPGHEHAYPIFPLYKDFLIAAAQSQIAYTPTLLLDYGGPCAENFYFEHEDVLGDEKLKFFTPKPEFDRKTRRREGWFADEEYVFDEQSEFIKDLVNAGGIACVGAHGQLQGLGFHWELWSIQSGGMSNHNALKVATLLGAKAIGLDKDLGSLEKGKLADLVILNNNPLDDIRHTKDIMYVMRNGRIYDAGTLDEVLPEKRSAPTFDWQEDAPENIPGISSN